VELASALTGESTFVSCAIALWLIAIENNTATPQKARIRIIGTFISLTIESRHRVAASAFLGLKSVR